MTEALVKLDDATLLSLITEGDCSKLNPQQKIQYYNAMCQANGLDPRTRPFEFTKMNGKLVLYARKEAANQLSSKNKLQYKILSRETVDGIHVVTCRVASPDGRENEDIGCVNVQGLKGDQLCNAYMKATTKARRRAALGLCGLGANDETELETIPRERIPAPEGNRMLAAVATAKKNSDDTPVVTENKPTGHKPEPAPTVETEPITKDEIIDGIVGGKTDVVGTGTPPAEEPIIVESAVTEYIVVRTASKSGEKDGKPWTRYGIQMAPKDGAEGSEFWVNTFSKTLYETAEEVKGGVAFVAAEIEDTQYGKDIHAIRVIGEGDEGEPKVPF